MSKLRFTVAACSGEDPEFPVRELNEHAANSKGYMTPRNCDYPQEIILKLDSLSRITQVQLLSHQTHIATKIELFLSKNPNLNEASFQRLGYLTLKSNEESNFMARELKTVHIDNEAIYVKFLLHQCYLNERNLYSQVGIMAINLCGDSLDSRSGNPDELPNQTSGEIHNPAKSIAKSQSSGITGSPDDLTFDLRFDAKTADRIREIQMAKDKAVAMEDYDQAKRLKRMEEHLKSIGLQLARLEAQKREAVANEDYDLAKRIKDEICMLEASATSQETQPIHTNASSSPTYSIQSNSSVARSQVGIGATSAPRVAATKTKTTAPTTSSASSFSPRDMYPERQSIKKNAAMYNEDAPAQSSAARKAPVRPNDEDVPDRRRPTRKDVDQEEEEEEVDGGHTNGPNPHFTGFPDAEHLSDPEPIPMALEKENTELIELIGLFYTQCLYSNLWNHREIAIRKVTLDLDTYEDDPLHVLTVCSTLAQSGAGDRIAQVSLAAFRLVEKMITYGSMLRREVMCTILGTCITQIVNKLGEPQTRVRDEAIALLLLLASTRNVGVVFITSHLLKRSKKPFGIKFLYGRLVVLKQMLEIYDIQPNTEFSLDEIMSFLEETNSFNHQAKEIREIAKDITVGLYMMIGSEVEGYLKSLRPKQMEEYQTAFEGGESARAAATKVKNKPSASNTSTHTRSQPRLPVPTEEEEEEEENASVDEYTCPFCGIVDDHFDSDGLDQHFWADCCMLTPCKMCGQVIEISSLNEHLLVECELKMNHKECIRCGEAITIKYYQQHIKLDDCPVRPHPKKANRCPLCHEDIPPSTKGWLVHLVQEICPNNPRTQS